MHDLQEKLLKVLDEKELSGMTLRKIGALVGEASPQKIKHHLGQLEKKGFIIANFKKRLFSRVSNNKDGGDFISLPIVGLVTAGVPELFADENIEGHLKVSKRLLPKGGDLFAVQVTGNSLNRAEINDKNVEEGDFIIVDASDRNPETNQYVVSEVDGLGVIKKFIDDKENNRIVLRSESTESYPPIFIHKDDDFRISGKVVDVIKG